MNHENLGSCFFKRVIHLKWQQGYVWRWCPSMNMKRRQCCKLKVNNENWTITLIWGSTMKIKTRPSMILKPDYESAIKVLLEIGVNHEYEVMIWFKGKPWTQKKVIKGPLWARQQVLLNIKCGSWKLDNALKLTVHN